MGGVVIVSSAQDPAGSAIRDGLLATEDFVDTGTLYRGSAVLSSSKNIVLATTDDSIVSVNDLDAHFEAENYVFVSRHRAESGIPSLTAHFTGNFGGNEFGGFPGELAFCNPSMLKNYLGTLMSKKDAIDPRFTITQEASHHGPTSLSHPVLFVELGSGPKEWEDRQTARTIAEALLESLQKTGSYPNCAIAIGGTHYSEKIRSLILNTEICVGHIMPKHALDAFSPTLLRQAVAKTVVPVTHAALDWKGLGKHKAAVLDAIQKESLKVIRL